MDCITSNLQRKIIDSQLIRTIYLSIFEQEKDNMKIDSEILDKLISSSISLTPIIHRITSSHIRLLFDKYGETPFINSGISVKYLFDHVLQQ